MSLTVLFGILTLAPAVAAILVLALGLARRPSTPAILVLAALGAVAPIVALIELAPDVSFVIPLRVLLLDGRLDAAFAPLLRADSLGLYAAFGVAVLVTPFLLWVALRSAPKNALLSTTAAGDDDEAVETEQADESEVESAPEQRVGLLNSMLSGGQWASVALILGLESALLMVCFADNVGWLAFCWLVAVALVWALGEVGSDPETLDYPGLGLLALGPALWLIAMLFVMNTGKAPTLLDLTGSNAAGVAQSILLAIAFAAAGGGYPFLVWLRRRAAFATPAGLAAIAMGVVPAALFIGGRTYGAVTSTKGLWPVIGVANPPVTAGVAFVVLGGLSVAISGLLALGRRDVRSLVALLATSQIGWGLVAIGTEQPASIGALIFLLATSVLGMGALIGSAVVGGMLSADDEPEGAGPRPYDQPLRMLTLLVWAIGALTLLGVPLFAGFNALELISASALEGSKVAIPLVGLAWAGAALLTISVLRATAPALTYTLADDEAEEELLDEEDGDEEVATALVIETAATNVPQDAVTAKDIDAIAEGDSTEVSEDANVDSSDEPDESDIEVVEESAGEARESVGARFWRENLPALPAIIFAALALALGIVPQALVGFGANLAVGDLLSAGAFPHNVNVTPTGFILPAGQWLPSIAWIVALALVIVFALLRLLFPRTVPALDEIEDEDAELIADEDAATLDEELEESPSLAAPTEAWDQLAPIFTSEWLQPGATLLLDGTDDEAEDESEAEALVDEAAADGTSETAVVAEVEQDEAKDDATVKQNGASATPRSKSSKRLKDDGE